MRSAAGTGSRPCSSSVPVARGDDQPGSDLDLLYDTVPGTRLGWEIDDFAEGLTALFGRPVDLVSRRAINPRLRERFFTTRDRSMRRDLLLIGEMIDAAERTRALATETSAWPPIASTS